MQIANVNFGKNGQMKIQQMAFMLLAVTLFFVLAGIFFLVLRFSNLKDTATELEAKNAQELISKLANSPEFSCGDSFDYKGTNCVDADKMMMLIQNKEKYKDFWGDLANIDARIIYPDEETIVCTLSNYPNCNSIRIYTNNQEGYSESNFISLCRKEELQDKCVVARLILSYNAK